MSYYPFKPMGVQMPKNHENSPFLYIHRLFTELVAKE